MHGGVTGGCGRHNHPKVWTGLSAWPRRHLATFEPSSRGEITSVQSEFSTPIRDGKKKAAVNKSSDTKLVALVIKRRVTDHQM